MHRVIREVASSGRTVLLSSHDMGEVEELCDAVTILREGQVVHAGPLAELRARADAPTYLLGCAAPGRAGAEVDRAGGVVLADPEADPDSGGGTGTILLAATEAQVDAVVLGLAAGGIPVRSLVRRDTALNAMFLRLTGPSGEQ